MKLGKRLAIGWDRKSWCHCGFYFFGGCVFANVLGFYLNADIGRDVA